MALQGYGGGLSHHSSRGMDQALSYVDLVRWYRLHQDPVDNENAQMMSGLN